MLIDALQFLLNTFINLLTLIFLLRFFMQLFKAPFNNPLGQMVMTLSNFAVKPLRRFLPSVGKMDVSTLLLAVLAQFLLQYCLILLRGYPLALAGQPAWLGLIGLSFLGVVKTALDVFFYALLLQVILSWVNPFSPIAGVLDSLTRPILTPIRRFIPTAGGIDFSPMVAIIIIQMLHISVIANIEQQLKAFF